MKIKEGFIKHQFGEKYVVIATGDLSVHFHGMIELNQTGSEIWDALADGKEPPQIIKELSEKYEADSGEIENDVTTLIRQMQDAGIFEE